MLAVVQHTVSSPSTSPATSALRPMTPCTQVGRNAVAPISSIPPSSAARLPAAIIGLRHRRNGRIGAGLRRSRRANAARASAPAPTSSARPAGPNDSRCTSAAMTAPTPSASSPAPARSMGAVPPAGAGSCRYLATSASVSRPMGRLTQNTQGHPSVPTKNDPSSGPTMAAMPQMPLT